MRLFHVSEEPDIQLFEPRKHSRNDLDKDLKLVWAIDELRVPNFLTPRNCPRIAYHIGENTTSHDIAKYFSSATISHTLIIENKWFVPMKETTLYLYEFDPSGFELQDPIAGYYVATSLQKPIAKHKVDDLFAALFERNVEIRIVDNLWGIADEIVTTTLNWSLCRMGFAQPRL